MTQPLESNVLPWRTLWALGIHSAAIIAYQLTLIQLISYMQGYHFAYMVISIAMLGFGASGTFLALFRSWLIRNHSWLIPALMAITAIMMAAVFMGSLHPAIRFDAYLLFVDKAQFLTLAVQYLLFFLPFFSGALAIGILFIRYPGAIGKSYFSNLLGSGLGGLLVLFLLARFFPERALSIIALMAVSPAVLAYHPTRKWLQAGLIVAALAVSLFSFQKQTHLPVSQYKSLSRTQNLPEARLIVRKPGTHGVIEVIESPALRYAPALSFNFSGQVPVKPSVFVNADYYGSVHSLVADQTHIYNYTTENLLYAALKPQKVLIAGAGTAPGMAHALFNGASKVVAVIENPGVKNLIAHELYAATDARELPPQARLVYSDVRQYLYQNAQGQYDAIILPRQESFGGSIGIHALREEYALTLEAFGQMWKMLSPQGAISITSWIDFPARTTLKTAITLMETLKNQEIENPGEYLAVVRSWGTMTFLLKKSPWQQEQKQNILDFCQEMLFDVVFLPGADREVLPVYNILEDQDLEEILGKIFADDYAQLLKEYPFYLFPATDNKPYFSRFMRAETLPRLRTLFGVENLPFLELGYMILWVTLLQSTLLAFFLILLPLFRLKKTGGGKIPVLVYFGALGIGYMFVEIIFIQRFVLYFGHPVYAITAVIGTMLIASGAGSLMSGKLMKGNHRFYLPVVAISLILLLYGFLLTPVLTLTIGLPFAWKVAIALALIAIPGFFMGMPFPLGISWLNQTFPGHIPWAWGINGCLSVIASSLATLLAVEFGFRIVIYAAAICYGAASLVYLRQKPTL